jgi:FtsP/CotA-like multicopper oxidase with cupredoxin domain
MAFDMVGENPSEPKKTVRIAWYPDDRPGMWMYHCHILEHHAAGMMAHFEVKRP